MLLQSSSLIVAAVQDLVTVVMNSDSEFHALLARAVSLPGLLQRLEEITLRAKEVRYEDVKDFDDIGIIVLNCSLLTERDGVVERHRAAQKKSWKQFG
jgi:hypothetical protein